MVINSGRRTAMNNACLIGHNWDGCKCKHCGIVCDEQHDWDGYKCKRCGKKASNITKYKYRGLPVKEDNEIKRRFWYRSDEIEGMDINALRSVMQGSDEESIYTWPEHRECGDPTDSSRISTDWCYGCSHDSCYDIVIKDMREIALELYNAKTAAAPHENNDEANNQEIMKAG
jgi:hypothetical protein